MASTDPALRDQFLNGMSAAACTVNVVTTDGAAGRAGVTVSAMSSVSADTPRPTLLVCVHHKSRTAPRMLENGVFCVNVLRDDQSYISDTFAGRFPDVEDKFVCADWCPMRTGAPRVVDPLVAFDCRVVSSDRVGTHHVFIGEVEEIFVASRGSPLVYANRAYGATSRIEGAPSIEAGRTASQKQLKVGCYHTFGPFVLPEIVGRLTRTEPGISVELVEGDQRRVQEALSAGATELALLYDIDLPGDLHTDVLANLRPYVLLAEAHPLAAHRSLTPEQLAPHPMVLLDTPPSRDYFPGILTGAGVTPHIAYRSSTLETVRGLVAQGLGYALLVTKPASAMSYDGKALVTRPLVAELETSRIVLATRQGETLSGPASAFGRICYEYFALS